MTRATELLTAFFDNEDNLGVTYDREQGASFYPDGSSACHCTSGACQVKKLFPGQVEIFGWHENRSVGAAIDEWYGGHDFALLRGRWLIDVWMRHVIVTNPGYGEPRPWREPLTRDYRLPEQARSVYDLENPDDARMVRILYGDRRGWERCDVDTLGDDTLPPAPPPAI